MIDQVAIEEEKRSSAPGNNIDDDTITSEKERYYKVMDDKLEAELEEMHFRKICHGRPWRARI